MSKAPRFPNPSLLLSMATALNPMAQQLAFYVDTMPDDGPFGIRNDVRCAQADVENAYARLSYLLLSQSSMSATKRGGAFEMRASNKDENDES